jgi:aldehyde:ferredoxin oxidoreductase
MPAISFRLLEVDLTTGRWEGLTIPAGLVTEFLGGASLAARLLYRELTPALDPLAPEAPLLFLTGPLTGTAGPSVGRFVICGKSPATGFWAESNAGGFFGPELRQAGWDGLLIRGRCASPAYLWITEDQVALRPADHLWGKADTYETQERLRAELADGGVRVACIGAGGEALIPFALVLCDHGRVAGRTGMGAVMGSKNLKAVAVRGRRPIPLAEPSRFHEARSLANRELRDDTVTLSLRSAGSASAGDYFDYLGSMPKRYFTRGDLPGASVVSGSNVADTILAGVSTCHGCVIACGRKVRLDDGVVRKGPEYETMVGFGPNLEILDLSAITRLGELCDRYGLDSISMSNVIGLAFLLQQEGRLSVRETDGLDLEWGNPRPLEALIHRTVQRRGLGQWLAEGARAMARRFDVPEMAAEVKGLEVAYHDPRGVDGMALVYATSPRGACHNQSDYFMVEIGQTIEDVGVTLHERHGGAVKAPNVARHQDWRTVGNSLVLCQFANVPPPMVVTLVNTAIGADYDVLSLLAAGERGWQLKRLVNLRLGLQPADDRMPGLLRRPLPDGGAAGYDVPFEEMLRAYYDVREWDHETGRPSRAMLRRLGLEDEARLSLPAAVGDAADSPMRKG